MQEYINEYPYGIELSNGQSILIFSNIKSAKELIAVFQEKKYVECRHSSTWQEKNETNIIHMNRIIIKTKDIIGISSIS